MVSEGLHHSYQKKFEESEVPYFMPGEALSAGVLVVVGAEDVKASNSFDASASKSNMLPAFLLEGSVRTAACLAMRDCRLLRPAGAWPSMAVVCELCDNTSR